MSKQAIIQKITGENATAVTYIEQGLTNDNYHVVTPNHDLVIRIPRDENEGLFDYSVEATVLKSIESLNLDTPLFYYNAQNGVKASQYIPHVDHYDNQYIEEAAQLIRHLHDAHLSIGKRFSILEKFRIYKKATKNPLYNTAFAHYYVEEADQYDSNLILCHNDLVEGNLLFSPEKNYLIDYEYAMDNDPFFDIMSFITENDIQDRQLRERFYQVYFGHQPTKEAVEKLKTFEIAHHVLWCQWAMMMNDLHDAPIYREIAALKYRRLREFF